MAKKGGGGGKISSVKRNNKNVTKLERQGKLNRKAGKRAGGSAGKKPVDKKVARQKESDKAHRAAVKAKREEEEAWSKERGQSDGEEEEDESVGDEAEISAKDVKDFGKASFSILSGLVNKWHVYFLSLCRDVGVKLVNLSFCSLHINSKIGRLYFMKIGTYALYLSSAI